MGKLKMTLKTETTETTETTGEKVEAAVDAAMDAVADKVLDETAEEKSERKAAAKEKAAEKKKAKYPEKTTLTPGQIAMGRKPTTAPPDDPFHGVTFVPDQNYPKLLNLIVTAGDDDERTMEEFIEDVKDALTSKADVKNATVLLSKYAIDGKHILAHHVDKKKEAMSNG